MQIRSNKINDIRQHYLSELRRIYPEQEAGSLLDLLIDGLLNISRTQRALTPDLRISESEILKVHFAVKQLKQHRPLQYILGTAEFYGLSLRVDERVLVPRPETEELVEWIVSSFRRQPPVDVLDIGTGSGCIALALKKNLPGSTITALDVSGEALQVAVENANRLNLDIRFLQWDILTEKANHFEGCFDVVVSNPPYVAESEKAQMQKNVLDHEPGRALFVADEDPLLFYRAIAGFAMEKLRPGGSLFLEINERFGPDTKGLLRKCGFAEAELRRDLSGRDRMLAAKKP